MFSQTGKEMDRQTYVTSVMKTYIAVLQVQGSREGIRKALGLVWSQEQQVRESVMEAYVRLYLKPQVREGETEEKGKESAKIERREGKERYMWNITPPLFSLTLSRSHSPSLSPPPNPPSLSQADNPRQVTASIVQNLLSLTEGATYGELASLEEMIGLLVKGKFVPAPVVKMLWDKFTRR